MSGPEDRAAEEDAAPEGDRSPQEVVFRSWRSADQRAGDDAVPDNGTTLATGDASVDTDLSPRNAAPLVLTSDLRAPAPDPAPEEGAPIADPDEASTDPTPDTTAGAGRRLPRRAARVGLRGLALSLLGALVFAALLPVLMIGQEITAPSWIKARVEAQAARVLGGGTLTFGAITVEVGRDLHPLIRLRDAVLRDADGRLLARVPQVEGQVSPRGLLLRRELLVQKLRLVAAEIALRRDADGRVALSFDGAGAGIEAAGLGALVDGFDALFDRPALAALETVEVANLALNFQDARAGRGWLVDGGRLSLDLRGDATQLRADLAVLSGRNYVTALRLIYESPHGSPEARLDLSVVDVAAADVATQSAALAWLGLLDARLTARLTGGTLADGTLAPLTATLEIGAGAVQPSRGAAPMSFDGMIADLTFAPDTDRIDFARLEVAGEFGRAMVRGHADLRDLRGGLPRTLIGQFEVPELTLDAGTVLPVPLDLTRGYADFRLHLAPFSVEFGQVALRDGGAEDAPRLTGSGAVAAGADGWRVALDMRIDRIEEARVLALWPEGLRPGTRAWFAENFTRGWHENLSLGLRLAPDTPVAWALSEAFADVSVRPMRRLPPITGAAGTLVLQDGGMVLSLAEGTMTIPEGGDIALAGSTFRIPDIAVASPPATIALATDSSLGAALALLDQPPFGFLTAAGLPVDLGEGRVRLTGEIALPLAGSVPRAALDFGFQAEIEGVRSEVLVPGRVLASELMQVSVSEDEVRLSGPVHLDGVMAEAVWRQAIGPGSGGASRIEAEVRLDDAFFRTFDIALPPGLVGGAGTGTLALDLRRGAPPAFRLTSDLRGLTLALPALGWSKPAGTSGTFEVAGSLGPVPVIDRIALTAPGFEAAGDIRLADGGGLDRLHLDRLRVGGWLSVAADVIGRGPGRAVEVRVTGGTIDLRQARLGQGGGGGEVGPMTIALDRLDVANGISLTAFGGTFDGTGGFDGRFRGLLNGAAPIEGVVAPVGDRLGVRVLGGDAGAVLAAAGLLQTAAGGTLDLTLLPAGEAGSYDGTVAITDLRVVEAPALARLLDAISVVGLLQQLAGQGLAFTNVDVDFRLAPDRITVTRASAVGPGLGISADGFYEMASRRLDFQGVVSPVYLLNGIGSILTRPGEGLFGFNFTVRGPVSDAAVSVNPLSVLTPGMFREIFRRPVPVLD